VDKIYRVVPEGNKIYKVDPGGRTNLYLTLLKPDLCYNYLKFADQK